MELSNTLIYEQRLECSSEEVAMATLHVPLWNVAEVELKSDWLKKSINPSNPVCFLDTDQVNATIVLKIINVLILC